MGDGKDHTGKVDPPPVEGNRPYAGDAGPQGVGGRASNSPTRKESTSVHTASGASVSAGPSVSGGDGSLPGGQQRGDSSDMAGIAKQSAGEAAEYAKNKTRSFAEEQKTAAASRIGGVAEALRKSARQLQEGEQSPVADYVGQAADKLDGFARSLRDQDVRALMTQAEDLARRQPGLFLGGAMLSGFLLARFLKSSGERSATTAHVGAQGRYTSMNRGV